jgi:hypothetical protein
MAILKAMTKRLALKGGDPPCAIVNRDGYLQLYYRDATTGSQSLLVSQRGLGACDGGGYVDEWYQSWCGYLWAAFCGLCSKLEEDGHTAQRSCEGIDATIYCPLLAANSVAERPFCAGLQMAQTWI